MAHWGDRKQMAAGIGSVGLSGHICFFLGIIFAVIGVIGDASNLTLGLESISWFLLAIVVSLLAVSVFIGWAVAWYLASLEGESKGEEGKD